MTVDVVVDHSNGADEHERAVKISSEHFELNVFASAHDLASLREIRDADWTARRAIRVGECAGAPVFWCRDGSSATVMVGHDDETWDVAVHLPLSTIDEIVRQSARSS